MKEIIEEYGGAVLAFAGALSILTLLGFCLSGRGSLLGQFLFLWGNGGC